jgi:TRAP-type C4-dicarboxylate transport system permease small subunit
MLGKIMDHYCRFLTALCVLALAVMVVLVFGNVVLRYGFNSGLTMSEELSRWLFVWMTFLGAVVALNERSHLGSDMLVQHLPIWGKKVCLGLSHLLMLFVCWLLFKGSWDQALVNLETTSPVMEFSMSIFYASGAVCAVSSALIILKHFFELVTNRLSEAELIGIRESEDEPLDLPKPQA